MLFEKQSTRVHRMADLLQRELARVLMSEVRDPRIRDVTINQVEISKDMSFARVYMTCMYHDPKEVSQALNKAAAFVRSKLMARLHLRTIPQLKFVYDEAVVRGNQLVSLIDKTVAMENGLQDS